MIASHHQAASSRIRPSSLRNRTNPNSTLRSTPRTSNSSNSIRSNICSRSINSDMHSQQHALYKLTWPPISRHCHRARLQIQRASHTPWLVRLDNMYFVIMLTINFPSLTRCTCSQRKTSNILASTSQKSSRRTRPSWRELLRRCKRSIIKSRAFRADTCPMTVPAPSLPWHCKSNERTLRLKQTIPHHLLRLRPTQSRNNLSYLYRPLPVLVVSNNNSAALFRRSSNTHSR